VTAAGERPASGPELSIILPVHNAAQYLAPLIAGYRAMLERLGRSHEILLVTNGCSDDSRAISDRLASETANVAHVELHRRGWGCSVRAGLAAATGTTICYTNLARTSPEALGLLLAYNLAYPDVVVKASRKVRDNWRRRLGSLIYNLECRALFDLAVWDINGTPKVFPRSFSSLLELERDDDLIDAEFVARCRRDGYPIVDVPILATHRHGGRSTTGYVSAARMYVGALALRRAFDAR
jgi:glycosyltransferase involved in cell wall biosynthesis